MQRPLAWEAAGSNVIPEGGVEGPQKVAGLDGVPSSVGWRVVRGAVRGARQSCGNIVWLANTPIQSLSLKSMLQ